MLVKKSNRNPEIWIAVFAKGMRYAVFLPRRSAIASTSWIGKLVILAVKVTEAPSFNAFSAISILSYG